MATAKSILISFIRQLINACIKENASKRTSLKRRYSIKAKVSEHHRKQNKEAKRNPFNLNLTAKKKDPGLPKNLPFRDKILKQIEYHKERVSYIEEDKQKRKDARKAFSGNGDDSANLAALLSDAASRSDAFETS
ncbi:Guanine nucleotide-binding protein-like 3, partial [Nowakowskiella sp. JEL0078]